MATTTKTLTVTVTSVPPINLPPVWSYTTVSFTQGVASNRLASAMVSDATGPVSISVTGTGSAGVSWDDVGKLWVYNGIGAVGVSSWVGSASDGVNPPSQANITVSVVAMSSNIVQWSLTVRAGLPGSCSAANPVLPTVTKHARWCRDSVNNKWYMFGGDYGSVGLNATGQSGQNLTLSLEPVTRDWDIEYPICGKPGQRFAPYADEVAISWDSTRNVFWITEGYQGGSSTCVYDGVTNGIPTEKVVMTFNPATQDWAQPFGITKMFYSVQTGGGQHMRSVYDPVRDLIYGPAGQAAYNVFNPTTGVWSHRNMTGIPGNAYVSSGQTVHLIGDYMYWNGLAGASNNKNMYETNVVTQASKLLATLPYGVYDDQDYSYFPSIDSFLIATEHPNQYFWLVNRTTGAISPGPPLPLLTDNTTFRPQHNNYDPTIDAAIVGWSASDASYGKMKNEYWEYRIDPLPTWVPAPGNVKAIDTDAYGMAVNDVYSVRPSDYSPAATYYGGGGGVNAETRAWASAAYARDFSSNGAILLSCGGDGDYWGTEVYAFDLTSRRWSRLCEPHRNMTGGPNGKSEDPLKPTTDPNYFSIFECEHGPAVASDVVGLLPITPYPTTPGVPHTYDCLTWIPGSIVGNRRGALLRPVSSIIYATRSTSRAHYYDLDVNRWGRFSDRLASFSPVTPTTVVDESLGRVYHNYGYLDLAARHQVARSWSGIPYSGSSAFDANRRLWVHPTNSGSNPDLNPGGLNAFAVDSTSSAVALTLTDAPGSTRWNRQFGYCGGILWCPDLDCFFFYNSGTQNFGYQRQKIWKISPPSSSPLVNAWQVTEITMPGDTVTGDAGGIGNFKRFLWISSIKCIAIINGPVSGGKVFLYKPEGI